MRTISTAVLVVSLIAFPRASGAAETFEVQLQREVSVGLKMVQETKYHCIIDTLSHYQGKSRDKKHYEYHYSARFALEVVSLDKDRRIERARITIDKLESVEEAATRALLKPGDVVTARLKENQYVYKLNGEPLQADALTALQCVVSIDKSSVNLDELWTTEDKPLKAGTTLKADAPTLARLWAEFSYTIDPKEVDGTLTIVRKQRFNDIDCVLAQYELRAKNYSSNSDGPWEEVGRSSRISSAAMLPLDPKLPIQQTSDAREDRSTFQYRSNPEWSYEEVRQTTRESIEVSPATDDRKDAR